MKNFKLVLLGLLALVAVSSCSPTPTSSKTDIPVEVVKLKENKSFDTTISIATDTKTYVFDRKSPTNDYVTTIDKESHENAALIGGIILGALIAFFVCALFSLD